MARISAAVLIAAMLLGACDDSPTEIDASELPPQLRDPLENLQAEGFDAKAVEAGPRDTPVVFVDAEHPVVMVATKGGLGPNDLGAILSDAADESIGSVVSTGCPRFVFAEPAGPGKAGVFRPAGGC